MLRSRPGLLDALRSIVGRRHVLTGAGAMRGYCRGYRFGAGTALAVIRPGSLVELWRVAKTCVAAEAILIMQSANTGLTGGSTPDGDAYDAPVVVISTARLTGLQLVDGGKQVIALPGARLHELEELLRPLGREPHSVIGSSCIGASVVGGVCNNSGGALVRRGPAYTELALFGQLGADGELHLVNSLGIDLGTDPEAMLARLDRAAYSASDVRHDPGAHASDRRYCSHVRDVEAPTPARFNADPRCLNEASGSAGRVIVFAVRLDTFAADTGSAVFYVGANDPDVLTRLRRRMLAEFTELPIAAEYVHRDAFDMAARYGKDVFVAIERFGTARLPAMFRAKAGFDAFTARIGLGDAISDRLLQKLSGLLGQHLPERMRAFRDRYEHHLLLQMPASGIEETRRFLAVECDSPAAGYFECDAEEARKAFLHRFAVASAAVRYRAVQRHRVGGLVALDIALPRNTLQWLETLPVELDAAIAHKLYYGHFFCQVFHQDYLVKPGQDPTAIEHRMWRLLDARGAEYPAEHNVGHLYPAKPALAAFYRELDPLNRLNPGIGQTSRTKGWSGANAN